MALSVFGALPRPVESAVITRLNGQSFRAGCAEVCGWRTFMQDAHVMVSKDWWGFFGLFDGHGRGGSHCSDFIAKRLTDELNDTGPPTDDPSVKEMMLRLDSKFLATEKPGGSTGTFAIVTSPETADCGKYRMLIGNIGDSRVLLGRSDGTMIEGRGTDGALTTDHKPHHRNERKRIERAGHKVFVSRGKDGSRIDGKLATSRSFGDREYKQSSGLQPQEQAVSAEPECAEYWCDSNCFLVLVCDGISEGVFPNRDVVRVAAKQLWSSLDEPDPGAAAAAVCQKALVWGSEDNLSCMIVLLGGADNVSIEVALQPGPFVFNDSFERVYKEMAFRAGLSLEQALEMRFDAVKRMIRQKQGSDLVKVQEHEIADVAKDLMNLYTEIETFGRGPPERMVVGSSERVEWFRNWLQRTKQRSAHSNNYFNILWRLLCYA